MVLTSSWTVVEQLAVSYLSQGFSRNDILKLLREESSHDHSDSELQQMLDNIILKQSQQGHTRSYHAQRPGEEWASDAVDGVIDDSRRQMPTGLADQLMTIQTEDENMVSLDESKHDVTQIRDPAREQYRAMHPPNSAGVPWMATEHAAISRPEIPVALAPTNPTIPAPSPFAPGQPSGPPINTMDHGLLGTSFGGFWGTVYDQNPLLSVPGTSGSGGGNTDRGNMSGSRKSGTGRKSGGGSSGDGKDQGRDFGQ